MVLSIDVDKERISLGVKQLDGDPFTSFVATHDKNSLVTGTVKSVDQRGAVIDLGTEVEGYLRVPGMLQSLMENAPPGAHVVVVGACAEDDRVLPVLAINKQLRFSFVFAYSPDEFAETLQALGQGEIDPEAFLTGAVGLGEAAGAFERLATPGNDVKVIVEPWR